MLIVILNWNGSQDTIDCCESLLSINEDASVNKEILIIDNNSSEKEFELLTSSFSIKNTSQLFEESLALLSNKFGIINVINCEKNITIFRSSINHGFAKGCNIGSIYADMIGYEYILFLNNDTVVQADFINPLVKGMEFSDVVIPQIRYFFDKSVIWNCGGEINFFGNRKYYYANQKASKVRDKPFRISFATGCCILFRTEYFLNIGGFSERFFFGEEDIDLSLRLLKLKSRVFCIPESIVFHKVGASLTGNKERILNKAYIHYLNRFINMKSHLKIFWWVWIIPSLIKVFCNVVVINKIGFIGAFNFIRCLVIDALKLDGVSKNKFESVINNGFNCVKN
ncbi:glycosyltransferase [Aeromonas veronii]|uniref:glycosyltransferase n=1 Tax=Aeromonas veronii TaxID=654 RepID=UPI0039F6EA4E